MLSISRSAGAYYRTRLLTADRAARFAACLSANAAFCDVAAVRSERAKCDVDHFVSFRPVSRERQAHMLERQQDTREQRAEEQGNSYQWVADKIGYQWVADKIGGRGFFWLLSTSGEVYEVHPAGTCSCPDFHYRCEPNGLRCKHLIALDQGRGVFLAGFNTIPARDPDEQRRGYEAASAEVAAIFG